MSKKRNETTDNPQATIKAPDLRQAIERVVFATINEQARYLLNVVRFRSDGSHLIMDATDGRRASNVRIAVELPTFEFLVSVPDCKAIKKVCARKRDTITISLASPRQKLTFQSSSGELVTVGNDQRAKEKAFPPIEHVFASEPSGIIPVIDPQEFRRGVSLAVAARHDGERVSKWDTDGNVIHITSTTRRTMVFGRSKRNGSRAITYFDSNDTASPVSLKVSGMYLLELLKVLPKSEPFELRTWNNWTDGIAYLSENFSHYLCGVHVRKSA